MTNKKVLADKFETTFDDNHEEKFVEMASQTEIQNAISRRLELCVMYEKPYNLQSTKPPMMDQGTSTEMSNNSIDYMAKGSQKFE